MFLDFRLLEGKVLHKEAWVASSLIFHLYFSIFTGKYVFLESSSPRKTGDKTRLVSQQFNRTSTTPCFVFYYHMSGQSIGSLNIYVNNSGSETLIWSLSGDKGTKWQNGQVNVASVQVGSSYKVSIEDLSNLYL